MTRSRSGSSLERGLAAQLGDVIGQVEREPPVVLAERLESAPHDLTGRGQRVEIGRLIALDARRQDLGLENRRDERRALQALDRIEQRVQPRSPADDALPVRDEASEDGGFDRLDLMPELRERPAADRLQHVRVAPLASGSAGPELSFEQSAAVHELLQQRFGGRSSKPVPFGQLLGRERPVRARVAPGEVQRGMRRRLEQRFRQSRRQRHAERVAVAARVLDRDEARLAGDRDRDRPPGPRQVVDGAPAVELRPGVDFRDVQIAEAQQQVVHAVDRPRPAVVLQLLQLGLDVGDRVRVEQVAQLGVAEQLAQLRLIDRQRLRATLGERRVAVVEVVGDVAEEQRRGERRGHGRVDGRDPDLPPLHPAERLDERRHVEDVAQALAIRLEDDRERPESRRDGEQIGRALALLPQRAAAARPALGQEQRAARRLAELGGEHRRSAELAAAPAPRLPRTRAASAADRAARRSPGTSPRTRRRSTSFRRRARFPRGRVRRRPSPTGRGCGRRTARGRRRASRRARRGSAR